MTTTTTTPPALAMNQRLMNPRVTMGQIGVGNYLAISGGRYKTPHCNGQCMALELPVGQGYTVRVTLAANDTYTVQRIMRRGDKTWVKGTITDVYAEDLGETAYVASCYRNRSFGEHRVEG